VSFVISDRESRIENLIKEVSTKYDDLQECKYQLHAVFIHQGEFHQVVTLWIESVQFLTFSLSTILGQANYGHYWIYIRDHVSGKWWKYNDTNVSEVNEAEIFKDTTGSTANPYFLVYVRSSGKQHLISQLKSMISLLTMYTQISLSML
jgi:hypothetical protein